MASKKGNSHKLLHLLAELSLKFNFIWGYNLCPLLEPNATTLPLKRLEHATVQDRFYLIRCTSIQEVSAFSIRNLKGQSWPPSYMRLWSRNFPTQNRTWPDCCLDVKQGRQELLGNYYLGLMACSCTMTYRQLQEEAAQRRPSKLQPYWALPHQTQT